MSGRRWLGTDPSVIAGMLVVAGLALLCCRRAHGCGFDLPTPLVTVNDEQLLSLPIADFRAEMKRLAPRPSAFHAVQPDDRRDDVQPFTFKVDLEDLKTALRAQNMPADKRERLLAAYEDVRRSSAYCRATTSHAAAGAASQLTQATQAAEPLEIPEGLPTEFAEYLRGAAAYHQRRMDEARKAWQAVLALPPDQRRYRSTWAAFMLARNPAPGSSPAETARVFERVRELAQQGYVDSLGLAASSYGWQAQMELKHKHFEQAIELYLLQLATGDDTAAESLQITAERALFCPPERLASLARHRTTQRVLTTYLVAKGGFWGVRPRQRLVVTWLDAVEATADENVAGADHLAWVAYQWGYMDVAQRWLDRAAPDAPMGLWVRSKLLLRAGKVQEAMDALARAARGFPLDEEWKNNTGEYFCGGLFPGRQVSAELGALHLARGQYIEALDLLMRGPEWLDASYVAERVLTVEELRDYVDRKWPVSKAEPAGKVWKPGDKNCPPEVHEAVEIRHLLARRLMRAGRKQEAVLYYPHDLGQVTAEYAQLLSRGGDRRRDARDRAADLWKAAQIVHEKGIELLGTEQEPDWAVVAGQFDLERAAGLVRAGLMTGLLASTPDERVRLARTDPPKMRWHYRGIAAEHAWVAAGLMPDDSDATARVLCEAGRWIRSWDPKAADRFYKALVRRCRRTELGREADRLHWFPPLPGQTSERDASSASTQPDGQQGDGHED